jgi:hypothetical protein
MRILRVSGRYLQWREQQLWASLAVIPLTLVALAIIVTIEVALAAVVAALLLVPKVARRLRNMRHGRLGERIVTTALRQLSDDYILINDVMLDRHRGNVDHVLIGPCGVVAIETKRLAGYIRCHGDTWSVNGYTRGSISRQVNSGATAIRYFLIERHPELRSSALRWIESVIVFTHPLCRLHVDDSRAIVVRFSELLEAILAISHRKRVPSATADALALALMSLGEE